MSIKKKLSNQENLTDDLDRQIIEDEVDRILKKSNVVINNQKKKKTIDFVIKNFPVIRESINKNVDVEQIEILSSRSKDDLVMAKSAYEKEIYWSALFHLQQSIEKRVKADGLCLGVIENPQKEKSHKSPKVYLKLLKFNWMNELSEICTPHVDIKKSLFELDSILEKQKQNSTYLDESVPLFIKMYEASLEQVHNVFSSKTVKKIVKETKNCYGIDIKELYMMQFEFTALLYLFSFVTWIYAVEPRYSGEYDKLNIIIHFKKVVGLLEAL